MIVSSLILSDWHFKSKRKCFNEIGRSVKYDDDDRFYVNEDESLI